MTEEIERNLGEQPIRQIMAELGLNSRDLVEASNEPITHKMISRACKGRRLTRRSQHKIRNALNTAAGKEFSLRELFTY